MTIPPTRVIVRVSNFIMPYHIQPQFHAVQKISYQY